MSKQIALVTGGNRGIGLATCQQLAEKNVRVYLGSRELPKGEQQAQKLQAAGLDVLAIQLDVSDEAACRSAIQKIEQAEGRLDILVNNAGVYLDEGVPISAIPTDTMRTTLEVNLLGPFYLMQLALPLMRARQYGRIVNVSSGYGSMARLSGTSTGSYKVSKIGLNALTRLFAGGVDGSQIKINAIDPGWVRTDMGGAQAARSPQAAAADLVWAATLAGDGPNGGFFYQRQPVTW